MQISLLFNPAFKISLGFVIIAQTIVASSTFFIAKLAQSVADSHLSLAYLIGFVASLTLVLIPLYFASIYLERAKFDALYQYNQAFEQHFLGKTHHYNNSQLKATAMAMLAQESKMTLDSSLDDIFDIITLIANVAFNLIVIAWVLDVWILAGYAVGILLAMGCVKLFGKTLKHLATTAQNSRLGLLSWLAKSWDNVIIFNQYNHLRYQDQLNNSFDVAKTDSVRAKSMRHVSANSGMIVLLICVLGVTGMLFYQHWQNMAVLAMLVATLPRQIQMLQMSHQIISYQAQINITLARLSGMFEILKTPDSTLGDYITADKIIIKQTGQAIDVSALTTHAPQTGRLTLIGQNGVGKSCMLLMLKEHFGHCAFYLPAKHELCFDQQAGSTGQQLISQLYTLPNQAATIWLLDEWDANLDSANKAQLNAWLDDMAQHKLIIEVRH